MGFIAEVSIFEDVPFIPPDAIFDLTKKYLADPYEKKVNLGQGTYRDENGNPFVLPSVKEAKRRLENQNHEYLPILGLPEFRKLVTELVLGKNPRALVEKKVSFHRSLREDIDRESGSLMSSSFGHRSSTSCRPFPQTAQCYETSRLCHRTNLVQPPPGIPICRLQNSTIHLLQLEIQISRLRKRARDLRNCTRRIDFRPACLCT
jgi:hypothetical protein